MKKAQTTNQTFANVCLASGGKFAAQIERVKNNIVAEFRETFEAHEQLLNHAINQADALAWQTEYPHLIFPLLAMEKIQAAANGALGSNSCSGKIPFMRWLHNLRQRNLV